VILKDKGERFKRLSAVFLTILVHPTAINQGYCQGQAAEIPIDNRLISSQMTEEDKHCKFLKFPHGLPAEIKCDLSSSHLLAGIAWLPMAAQAVAVIDPFAR
jgi:hypothetical protein